MENRKEYFRKYLKEHHKELRKYRTQWQRNYRANLPSNKHFTKQQKELFLQRKKLIRILKKILTKKRLKYISNTYKNKNSYIKNFRSCFK